MEGAQQQLREVARLDPRAVPVRLALGRVLLKLGRKTEAAEQFRAALQIAPGLPAAQQGLAEAATQP